MWISGESKYRTCRGDCGDYWEVLGYRVGVRIMRMNAETLYRWDAVAWPQKILTQIDAVTVQHQSDEERLHKILLADQNNFQESVYSLQVNEAPVPLTVRFLAPRCWDRGVNCDLVTSHMSGIILLYIACVSFRGNP